LAPKQGYFSISPPSQVNFVVWADAFLCFSSLFCGALSFRHLGVLSIDKKSFLEKRKEQSLVKKWQQLAGAWVGDPW
jgi:hypothetical protein